MSDEPNGAGRNASSRRLSETQIRKEARTWVYERLALLSSLIWALGAAVLLATIVPYIARPQLYIAVACLVPLIPAALPWLFYPYLSRARAARQLGRHIAPEP